jgi:hypothetical protein
MGGVGSGHGALIGPRLQSGRFWSPASQRGWREKRKTGPPRKEGPRHANGRLVQPPKICACGGARSGKSSLCMACWRAKKAADKMAALTCACGSAKTRYSSQCLACASKAHRKPSQCLHCGVWFRRRIGSKNSGHTGEYCSLACWHLARSVRARARREVLAEARRIERQSRPCTLCGEINSQLPGRNHQACVTARSREAGRRDYYQNRRVVKPRKCSVCEACFNPPVGVPGMHRQCSQSCRDEARRRRKKEYKRKYGRSQYSRAKRKGSRVEHVRPLVVLERDKWTCWLCGCSTPQDARGTTRPDAPEIDHVVPLALGGSHTYNNVRCACRACNGVKGAAHPSAMPHHPGQKVDADGHPVPRRTFL